MDEITPVTTPHIDRASDGHPVMHNPRNEARAAYFKKYKQHAPQGWPYTEDEVDEANQLLGINEGPDSDKDTDDVMDPDTSRLMSKIALKRLG